MYSVNGHATGERFAGILGINIVGREGHDLIIPCRFCGSRDNARLHGTTCIFGCYGCGAGLSPFELAKHDMSEDQARATMIDLGLWQADGNMSGKSTNGNSKQKRELAIDQAEWRKSNEPTYRDDLIEAAKTWAAATPPCTAEGLLRFKVQLCSWHKRFNPQPCIAIKGRNLKASCKKPAAAILYRVDRGMFSAASDFGLPERKIHNLAGSQESWIWAGSLDDLKTAETYVKVEGPSDAVALESIGLPDGWKVITNVCGASSIKLPYGFAKGKRVFVIGDADKPGQLGSQLHAAKFVEAGASEVRTFALPFSIDKSNGKDLRDYLTEACIG